MQDPHICSWSTRRCFKNIATTLAFSGIANSFVIVATKLKLVGLYFCRRYLPRRTVI